MNLEIKILEILYKYGNKTWLYSMNKDYPFPPHKSDDHDLSESTKAIMEIVRECVPENKQEKIDLGQETFEEGWNACIDEFNKNIGGSK